MATGRTEDAVINLTAQAKKAVLSFLESESKKGYGLRLSVVGGGCSGFQYDLSLDEKGTENDEVFNFGDFDVFVDKLSMTYLKGTTLDYVDDLRGSGFVFQNPNAVSSCGCGHSMDA